jgi:hypothetical protein
VSAGQAEHVWWGSAGDAVVRVNAAACGVAFVLLGLLLERVEWKAHFEAVAMHAGWALVLAALVSGLGGSTAETRGYGVVLCVVGAALAGYGLYARRFWLLAMGVLGSYVGLSALVVSVLDGGLAFYWFAATGLAILPGLFLLHRLVKERA